MNETVVEQPLVSIVIPIYQEEGNLRDSIAAVLKEVEQTGFPYEVILIDDGSEDQTWDVIVELSHKYSTIRALRLSRNYGKEAALCAGLEHAKGQGVLVMDSDLQHPPEYIPRMLSLWYEDDYDVVEAVKVNRGKESFYHKIGATMFYGILSRLSGSDFTGASDFKLLDRKVINAWMKMRERHAFFRGMITWLGFRRKEVPFEVVERKAGGSKWSLYNLFKLALTAVTAFSTFPLHIVTFIGTVFVILSAGLGVQTLYMKLSGRAVEGFTSVILLLLIIGSVLMLSLGIIGEYLARIYEELKHRPRFVISESINCRSLNENE